MSNRYKGGVISATPPTTTGGNDGVASGAWTLEQQMQAQAAGLWPNQPVFYIEDVFSTYLYTGNGSTQTITNGIDESGKGAMTWIKCRSDATSHALYDTERGAGRILTTNTTGAQTTSGSGRGLSSFNSTGFSLDDDSFSGRTNQSGSTYVSWTFRKQPKFFDVVTYTGNGSNPRTISHNLGSTPGCIIFKSFSDAGYGWVTWHRSLNANGALQLQTTDAEIIDANLWGGSPTDTTFSVSSYSGQNVSGIQYVAYVFAHNAGGFGLTGTDNVISCGSFDANLGEVINLGYEPQWLLYKDSVSVSNWRIADTMRGLTNLAGTNAQTIQQLVPNSTAIEGANSGPVLTSTGFTWNQSGGGNKHIYIAIRRGPMKVPTSGTSVFANSFGTATSPWFDSGFPVDASIWSERSGTTAASKGRFMSRFQGGNYMTTNSTDAESALTGTNPWDFMGGWYANTGVNTDWISWMFRRAPSFFDEVCYTGTGSQLNVNHNLGSVPELIIVKNRNKSGGENWAVYSATLGAGFFLWLNATDSVRPTYDAGRFPVAPTSSVFTVGSDPDNGGSFNYVAYLFATCAGVSKVGSYTGTATTKQIDCGFTAGSRFVMIKRTDSTGDWYVWDSARGIVAGNDPYLLLNSTAAEVTNTDYVDTYSAGFEISSTAPAAINANGGTFIFLAIA